MWIRQIFEIWAARPRLARKRREMLFNSDEYERKWDGIDKGASAIRRYRIAKGSSCLKEK